MIEIAKATEAHAYAIQLRACDLKEATEWCPGVSPADIVAFSIRKAAEAYVGLLGGEVVAVGGFSVEGTHITPWLVGSDLLTRHRKTMMRVSKRFIRHLECQHPSKTIGNYVAKDNPKARLFLQSLGFTIIPSPGSGEFDFFYLPKCVQTQ